MPSVEEIATGDVSESDQLVRRHMAVARDVARRFRGKGVPDDDLDQVAYLGLVKAARRFDMDKGNDFLAYAVPTIRGELRRYFRDHAWAVRPPRTIQQAQSRIRDAQAELCQSLGRSPRPSEIADHLRLDVDLVVEALGASGCYTPFSLDVSPEDFVDGDLPGALPRAVLGEEEPRFETADGLASLGELLARLTDREKTMLRMRFYEEATQAQIGKVLGVSQMQVSRLLSSLLARLRDEVYADDGYEPGSVSTRSS